MAPIALQEDKGATAARTPLSTDHKPQQSEEHGAHVTKTQQHLPRSILSSRHHNARACPTRRRITFASDVVPGPPATPTTPNYCQNRFRYVKPPSISDAAVWSHIKRRVREVTTTPLNMTSIQSQGFDILAIFAQCSKPQIGFNGWHDFECGREGQVYATLRIHPGLRDAEVVTGAKNGHQNISASDGRSAQMPQYYPDFKTFLWYLRRYE